MVNLYLWFGNDLAYWLGVTRETANTIMNDFEKGCGFTDHFIEEA